MSKTAINFGIGAGTGYMIASAATVLGVIGIMAAGAVFAVVVTHVLDIGYEG